MNNYILADYYEHNLLLKKAQRLRKRKPSVFFGWYWQYNEDLGAECYYGYNEGDGSMVVYSRDYYYGNGFWYR